MLDLDKSLNESDKEALSAFIAQAMHQVGETYTSSADFLVHLKRSLPNGPKGLSLLQSEGRDDQYGIFTLTLNNAPSDLEFRLKKSNAYGGPKTEHYLTRVDLRINAAIEWTEKYAKPAEKQKKREKLEAIRRDFREKITTQCKLDPAILKDLDPTDKQVEAHFNQQHKQAKALLRSMSKSMLQELKSIKPKKKDKSFKQALYNVEKKSMSKKRPERVTIRTIKMDKKTYLEVNTVSPVNPERTVSSAKKDEVGVANWLRNKTVIYGQQENAAPGVLEPKSGPRTNYRSASIVPHEYFTRKGIVRLEHFTKSGKFNADLARETAKRNVREHIIPALISGREGDPIEVNYEMLTLLSPVPVIALGDNPDEAQFEAIREALNYYHGRKFSVTMPGGETREVKFNAIYHNYGTNIGRSTIVEKQTNQKAYNQIVVRFVEQHPGVLDDLPQLSATQAKALEKLEGARLVLYEQMEALNPISSEEHKRLVDLQAKRKNKEPMTERETHDYKNLKQLFKENLEKSSALRAKTHALEKKIRYIHTPLAEKRQAYFLENHKKLAELAGQDPKNHHLAALIEYNKAVHAGYDSLAGERGKGKNKKNYEVQAYIQMLSQMGKYGFQKTCKSGKDRTGVAEIKSEVKQMQLLHSGEVPKFLDPQTKAQEEALFKEAYLRGSGNEICGDNMPPPGIQVGSGDFSATVKLDFLKKMSKLQKLDSGLKLTRKQKMADKLRRMLGKKTKSPAQKLETQAPAIELVGQPLISLRSPSAHSSYQLLHASGPEEGAIAQIRSIIAQYPPEQMKVVDSNPTRGSEKTLTLCITTGEEHKTPIKAFIQDTGKGLDYSIQTGLSEGQANLAIEKICDLAVKAQLDSGGANPHFDLEKTDPRRRPQVEIALKKAIDHYYTDSQKERPKISGGQAVELMRVVPRKPSSSSSA